MATELPQRLAAILAADIAGYTRLMELDEAGVVIAWRRAREEVIDPTVARYHGRIVKLTGDGFLAEFPTVESAVKGALAMQDAFATLFADLPTEHRVAFRMGVNVGDIWVDADDIYGAGVNVAARLEALATPGGVCISGSAYDAVKHKITAHYESLGPQTVKNVAAPIDVWRVHRAQPHQAQTQARPPAVAAPPRRRLALWWGGAAAGTVVVAALIAFAFQFTDRTGAAAPTAAAGAVERSQADGTAAQGPKTIAVLPFLNISSDPEQEYFADGLTEELLNSLAQINDFRVTARTSSFAFKGTNQTVQEIAGTLGVEHVLEGSVRKAGNRIRITAQLIRASDSFHLWSDTYDRDLKDIFAIQEEIAMAVAAELSVTLGIGDGPSLLGGTDNIEAYELYLAALAAAGGALSLEDRVRDLRLIDSAIDLDPKYALAWSLKSSMHSSLVQLLPVSRIVDAQDAAVSAALTAINLEPRLGVAYVGLAYAKSTAREWIEAEEAYRKARAFGEPNPASWGVFLLAAGHFERAYDQSRARREIDPLSQVNQAFVVATRGFVGDTQGALAEYRSGKEIYSVWPLGDALTTWLRAGTGDISSGEDIPLSGPFNEAAAMHFDSPGRAVAALRQLYGDAPDLNQPGLVALSMWAAYFGDPQFALEVMERLIAANSQNTFYFWYPQMQRTRQLPRFRALMREVGLVEYWNQFGWPDICRPLSGEDFECS